MIVPGLLASMLVAALLQPAPPEIDPEEDAETTAMSALAELYVQEGRIDDALNLYADLRTKHPDDPQWWQIPDDVLQTKPKYLTDRLLLLLAWMKHDPNALEPGLRLLELHQRDGAEDEARALLVELVGRHPNEIELLRQLAWAHESQNAWTPALAAWDRVVAHPEHNREDRWRRIDMLSVLDPNADLRAEYVALIKMAPDDLRFRLTYIDALLTADAVDQARTQIKRARAIAPDDPELAKLARELETLERQLAIDHAQDIADRLDELRPQMDWAHRLRRVTVTEDY